jgi:hypothetical protein
MGLWQIRLSEAGKSPFQPKDSCLSALYISLYENLSNLKDFPAGLPIDYPYR